MTAETAEQAQEHTPCVCAETSTRNCPVHGNGDAAVTGPEVLEGPGRYKVFSSPAGEWIVARSGPLCETCANCGCGEQAEPIVVPAMVVQLAMQNGKGRLMGMLKAVTGRG